MNNTNRPLARALQSGVRTLTLALPLILPGVLLAAPAGGQVVAGAASVQQNGSTLTINQISDRAIINWQNFSIGAGELTRFNQPGANSAVLNRVVSGNPSSLLGTLEANGQVFLINPNGILVGGGARINTAGFVASTLNVADAAFLLGGDLSFLGSSAANIKNLGTISGSSGDVILIARQVENAGTLNAPNGVVGLAAGQDVLLKSVGEQRIFVRPTSLGASTGAGTGVDNSGLIAAAQAELKAAGGNAYALAVNSGGIIQARGIMEKDGRVMLTSGGGAVAHTGAISAQNADGSGGTVLVGGDYQGANPEVVNASRTFVGEQATISVNAGASGNGGKAIVWADEFSIFNGSISARGGLSGGDGGLVETSGKISLSLGPRAIVNASASLGRAGQWLLDPTDFTVLASPAVGNLDGSAPNFTPNASANTISGSAIAAVLDAGTDVTLNTASAYAGSGNITFDGPIRPTTSTSTFRAIADGTITVNSQIGAVGTADRFAVTLQTSSGDITVNSGASVNGRNVTLTSARDLTVSGLVAARGTGSDGNLTLRADSTLSVPVSASLIANRLALNSIGDFSVLGAVTTGELSGNSGPFSTTDFGVAGNANSIATLKNITSRGNVTIKDLGDTAGLTISGSIGTGEGKTVSITTAGTLTYSSSAAFTTPFVSILQPDNFSQFNLNLRGSSVFVESGSSISALGVTLTATAGPVDINGRVTAVGSGANGNLTLHGTGLVYNEPGGTLIGNKVALESDTEVLSSGALTAGELSGYANVSNFDVAGTARIGTLKNISSGRNVFIIDTTETGAGLNVAGTIVAGSGRKVSLTTSGNLTFLTGGVVTSVDATGTAALTANNGQITGPALGTTPVVTGGGGLALKPGTGVGTSAAAPLYTAIGRLEAETTTGGVFVRNTGSLFIGQSATGNDPDSAVLGVRVNLTTGGAVSIVNEGSISLTSSTLGERVTAPGNITLQATGPGADIIVANAHADGIRSYNGTVTLSADRNVTLGLTTSATPGNATGATGVDVHSGLDVRLHAGSSIAAKGAGNVGVDAFSIYLTSLGAPGARITTEGGNINLTSLPGFGISLDSGSASRVYTTAGAGAPGNITLIGDDLVINSGINAGTANVRLRQADPTVPIDLGATGTSQLPNKLNLSATELDFITANDLRIGDLSYAGGITVSSAVQGLTKINSLSLKTGGAVTFNAPLQVSGPGGAVVSRIEVDALGSITGTAASSLSAGLLDLDSDGGSVSLSGLLSTSRLTGESAFGFAATGVNYITELGNITALGGLFSVAVLNAQSLTVNGLVNGGSRPVAIRIASGDLTLAAGSRITGSQITLASDDGFFINQAGAGALNAGTRYNVYSKNNTAPHDKGGLAGTEEFGVSFGSDPQAGNVFYFSAAQPPPAGLMPTTRVFSDISRETDNVAGQNGEPWTSKGGNRHVLGLMDNVNLLQVPPRRDIADATDTAKRTIRNAVLGNDFESRSALYSFSPGAFGAPAENALFTAVGTALANGQAYKILAPSTGMKKGEFIAMRQYDFEGAISVVFDNGQSLAVPVGGKVESDGRGGVVVFGEGFRGKPGPVMGSGKATLVTTGTPLFADGDGARFDVGSRGFGDPYSAINRAMDLKFEAGGLKRVQLDNNNSVFVAQPRVSLLGDQLNAGFGSGLGGPPRDVGAMARNSGLSIDTVNRIVAGGGGNVTPGVVAAIVAAGGGNLTPQQIVGIVAGGGGNLIGQGGSTIVAGGGNLQGVKLHPNMVAAIIQAGIVAGGGGNLIGQDGAGIVAGGGGNLLGQGGSTIVAGGGGNFAGRAIASIVAGGGGNITAERANALIGQGGSTLIGQGGSTLIGQGGSTLIGQGGSTLIGQGGSTLIGQGGSTLIAAGIVAGGGLNLIGIDGASMKAVSALSANDGGASLRTSLAGIVAGGGGNIVAGGGGNIVAGGGGNIVAGGGGNIVAGGGGNIVAGGGGNIRQGGGSGILNLNGGSLRSP